MYALCQVLGNYFKIDEMDRSYNMHMGDEKCTHKILV